MLGILCACQQSKSTEATNASKAGGELDRSSLPIKEPDAPFDTTLDARNAKAPARFEVRPRQKHRML